MFGYASSLTFVIRNCREDPRFKTLFGIVRALNMDANDIFYPEMKHGTPIQVKLCITFSGCSDSEAEMLYEVCYAVLSSVRKRERATTE